MYLLTTESNLSCVLTFVWFNNTSIVGRQLKLHVYIFFYGLNGYQATEIFFTVNIDVVALDSSNSDWILKTP